MALPADAISAGAVTSLVAAPGLLLTAPGETILDPVAYQSFGGEPAAVTRSAPTYPRGVASPPAVASLPLAPPHRELYLVAFDVPDREALVDDLLAHAAPGTAVVELHGGGVAEITAVLLRHTGLDAIRLLSHGAPGALSLGPDVLDSQTLAVHADDLHTWGAALNPGGDLLLYGCDVAAGAGREFVTRIASLTGADVAASTGATGSADLGGDWELEYTTGRIEACAVPAGSLRGWSGLLANVTVSTTADVVNGNTSSLAALAANDGGDGISLREAITAANNTPGRDTIALPAGTYRLASGHIDVSDDLTVTGSGPAATVVDGNNRDRVFETKNVSVVSMSSLTIRGGAASDNGGALFVDISSVLTLQDAVLTGNDGGSGRGGAAHVHGTLNLNRVLVSDNTAGKGGGIYFHGADGGTLANVTFSGNSATTQGGAVWTDRPITVRNSTVTLNTAAAAGGLYASGAAITVSDTIVAGNTATTDPDVAGAYTSDGFNLIGAVGAATGFASDRTGVSPNLAPLADNGGPTRTHSLVAGSPAIDAGTAAGGAASTDQRGYARSGATDIGAFEYNGVAPTGAGVTTTGDTVLVAADGAVYRIDARTGAVVATYPTGLDNDGVAVAPDGSLYVADYSGKKVFHYGPTGALIGSFGTSGTTPQGLAFGPDGNLYVTTADGTVERYLPDGSNHTTFVAAGSGGLSNAKAIVWGGDGNAYVASYSNSRVLKYDGATGAFLGVFAAGSGGFEDIAFGPDGILYAASYGDGKVDRYRGTDGAALGAFVTGVPTAFGVEFNPAGNLLVTNRSAGTVLLFDGTTGAALGPLATGLTNPAYVEATTSLVTTSAGGTATFWVSLNSRPAADVTIILTSSAPALGTLSQTTLTFTTTNWNTPQAVTVTGRDDGVANGDQAYRIDLSADGDPTYAALTLRPMRVVNREVVVPNRAPTAAADTYFATEDTALVGPAAGVLGNDSDPDGDTLVVTAFTRPAHGLVVMAADGSFTYTPAADYNGPDSFTYTVADGRGGTAQGTVGLNVIPVNDAPVARNDQYTTAFNLLVLNSLSVPAPGVIGNDTDAEGDPLTAQLLADPAFDPTFTLNADGSFTYTALLNFSGTDSFTYRVWDGAAWSAPATVTINVVLVNRAPAATPDGYATAEDTPLVVPAAGVLGNDSDPDGDTLTAVVDALPAHGTLLPRPDGGFTYTPDAGWSGTDSFTYHATDGSRNSPTVVVTLTVTAVDDPPTLDPIADQVVLEDTGSLTLSLSGITAGGGESQALTVTAVSSDPAAVPDPVVGYASPSTGGTLTFRPAAGANGTVTVTVAVSDGTTTTTQTFTVTVLPVNDAPTPAGDAAGTDEDVPVTIDVLGNDTDPDGDSLAIVAVGPAGHGTVLTDGATVTYTPDANWYGTDSFSYAVSDGNGGLSAATVAVTVAPANDPPLAADDGYTLTEGTTLAVPAPGVLANDADVDGDSLSAVLIAGPANGTLTLNADGSFTYTPSPGFAGTDSFNYKAADGGGTSAATHVVITVARANRPPVGADDAYATKAGVPVVVIAPGVLANDADPDGDTLTAELVAGGAHGTVSMSADGSFTYTPDPNFTGTDTFTYRVSDGQVYSGLVAVTVREVVLPVPTVEPPQVPATQPPAPPAAPTGTDASPATDEFPPTGTVGGPGTTSGPTAAVVNTPGPVGPGGVVSVGGVTTSPGSGGTIAASTTATPNGPGPAVSDVGRVYGAADGPVGGVAPDAPSAPAVIPPQPSPVPSPAPVSPPTAVALPPATAPLTLPVAPSVTTTPADLVPPETVLAPLDRVREELRAEAEGRAMTDTIVVSGGVAVAGYVLLNTRAVYWFLSALLARPAVWRRFDPLDVVYAWEKDAAGRKLGGPGPDDSLQSIVG